MNPDIKPSQLQLFINGKFVDGKSNKKFPTLNPCTEQVIAEVWEAGKQDVDDAVQAAYDAFQPQSPWRKMSAYDRSQLMYKLADMIEKNSDELASLECLDTGKSFNMCKMIDLPYTISAIRYYAGWCDKISGKTISIPGPYFCYTRNEPVGVCAQIIPWNVPLIMLSWKLGPALAAGCTVVLKPAEQTPLTALKIAEYIKTIGFPDGVVNIITGFGETGASLVDHPKVDKIAFTGSTEVGQIIMQRCSINNLKKISLELGGKSPMIVMDDANIDEVLFFSTMGVFFNSGQFCFSSSRIFVHEKIYDEFVKKQVERAKTLKVGDSWQPDALYGPVVDEVQFKKVLTYMQKGQEQGAKLECGGCRQGNKGYFIEPTVFSNVQDANIIAKEEIFGPSMQILKFKTVDEVIQRANNTTYGLAAGIFTKNIETYLKIANSLQAGLIFVNNYGKVEPQIPFGGYKMSGFEKEMGEEGLKPYLQQKVVVVKQSDDTLGF